MSLSDVPRKIKEKAEELGEKAEKAYHEKREEPVRQAAQQHYEEKHTEAREKLKRGDISRELYERRNAKYRQQRDVEAKPVEQRVAHSAKDIAVTVQKGAMEVVDKAAQDYRAGPPPRFGKGKGASASTRKTAAKRSTQRSTQPDFGRSPINFGGTSRGGNVDFGGSVVDFGHSIFSGGVGGGTKLDFSAPLFGDKKLRRK